MLIHKLLDFFREIFDLFGDGKLTEERDVAPHPPRQDILCRLIVGLPGAEHQYTMMVEVVANNVPIRWHITAK